MDTLNTIKNIAEDCVKMQRKTFKKGSTITTYIEKRKQICILLSGKADLIRYDLNGNKDIIENFTENSIFGEAFYPVNTNHELFVLAMDDCEVLLFLYDDIHEKCKSNCKVHSALVSSLLDLVFEQAIQQNTRIEILSKRSIRDKLLTYFSILSSQNFSKHIVLPMSLTSLADYLSVDRSAMTRELKFLTDEGFITRNGNSINLHY